MDHLCCKYPEDKHQNLLKNWIICDKLDEDKIVVRIISDAEYLGRNTILSFKLFFDELPPNIYNRGEQKNICEQFNQLDYLIK